MVFTADKFSAGTFSNAKQLENILDAFVTAAVFQLVMFKFFSE